MAFPDKIEDVVRKRSSVRTYEESSLNAKEKSQLNEYIKGLSNPFQVEVSFSMIETQKAVKEEKLGTYGMIKGAKEFIGASVPDDKLALEALGYSMEELILYATSLGLGTCWLGGSFNRSGFAKAMKVKENELLPAITPVGYPLDKKRVGESIARWFVKANTRKEFSQIFFKENFETPMTEKEAGDYAVPLEMLRLAPSAANRQPWRVLFHKQGYHFYKIKTKEIDGYDISRIDIGIAACHFHLAALEKGLNGRFETLLEEQLPKLDTCSYVFSWLINE